MARDYTGAEWKRILDLLTWFQSHPEKWETIYTELPELDQVKAAVATACRLPSQGSLKLLEAVVDNFAPELVLSALQIVPREELSQLVLQRFEGGSLSRAMTLIADSLSEKELIALAFMSLLSQEKLLLVTFLFSTLTQVRREEVIQGIQQKEGRG